MLQRRASRWHNPDASGRTYYLSPGQAPPREVELPEDILAAVNGSETGAVLFWSLAESHLVLPPFPVEAAATYDGWNTGPLHSLLHRPRSVLVLLLRLGRYSIGVFEGDRLVQSKTGTRFVKGRHRKGGSSSARFARHREGQARELFDKACEILVKQVELYPGRPDHFFLGGDRLTLVAFVKRCPYLERLSSIRLHRILKVGEPSLKVLQAVPREVYMSQLYSFGPEPAGFPARG